MSEKSLASLLRERRLATEDPATGTAYTQDVLAEMLGVAPTTISSWERGATVGMKIEYVNKLAKVLPVTVAELCRAIGYEVEDQALNDDERRLIQAFRRLRYSPIAQQLALASLEGMPAALGPRTQERTARRSRQPRSQ